jgi:hypothetical protein
MTTEVASLGTKSFSRLLTWLERGRSDCLLGNIRTDTVMMLTSRTPDDKLRWAFKMYDEDNSREVDIHEMERVMQVSQTSKYFAEIENYYESCFHRKI